MKYENATRCYKVITRCHYLKDDEAFSKDL